jgi:drug/metabolite transporter (DMT)-like permease
MAEAGAIVASVVAPLLMTVGVIVWGDEWQGSAFALNLYKCSTAGLLFILISLGQAFHLDDLVSSPGETTYPLVLSSLAGIVIGDNLWLLALQIIGARRVILVDSLKPLLAALYGTVLLRESVPAVAWLGVLLTCGGIAVVCLERESEAVTDQGDSGRESAKLLLGYTAAAGNVILDVWGSALTKNFGKGLSTWEISAVRFGFAAVVMWAVSLAMREAAVAAKGGVGRQALSLSGSGSEARWFNMPSMTRESWVKVSAGVALVTFATPALSNFGLLRLQLSLALTLGALGPVYALLLGGAGVTVRAWVGTVAAVLGVALVLAFTA